MVEIINKLPESQASERVRKVVRSDPDKKRDQQPNEESEFEEKDEKEEPKDEVIIAGTKEEEKETMEKEVEGKPVEDSEGQGVLHSKNKDDVKEDDNEDGHIDVTV